MPASSADEIGVGVIGYSIGRYHAQAYDNMGRYFYPLKLAPRLVGIAGRSKDRVDAMVTRMGAERAFYDWRELVEDEKVGLVDDCAPPGSHLEPMVMAAEAGKHLVCEKPLGRSSSEAGAMLRAAQKAGVKHMTGFNCRFIPAVRLVKQMIERGDLGKINMFRGAYLLVQDGYDDPGRPIDWHHKRGTAGYGALSDLGSHALDLARYLVGEVTSVCGAQATYIKERPDSRGSRSTEEVETDDTTVACLKFDNGALGTMEASWLATGRKDFLSFELYGSEGSVKFNMERINELEVVNAEQKKALGSFERIIVANPEHPFVGQIYTHVGTPISYEHTFAIELNHFLNCVADDRPVGPEGASFVDGYKNCLIMDSISESTKTDKWVPVPQSTP